MRLLVLFVTDGPREQLADDTDAGVLGSAISETDSISAGSASSSLSF